MLREATADITAFAYFLVPQRKKDLEHQSARAAQYGDSNAELMSSGLSLTQPHCCAWPVRSSTKPTTNRRLPTNDACVRPHLLCSNSPTNPPKPLLPPQLSRHGENQTTHRLTPLGGTRPCRGNLVIFRPDRQARHGNNRDKSVTEVA
jgi:hypothetical protein